MIVGTLVPGEERAAGTSGLAIFPGPIVLDLGCGNGVFLAALAAREPMGNFLGVEKKDYRVRQARRIAREQPNAQVVRGGVMEVLRDLPLGAVESAYLLFSDPWPKRRHASRRVVQVDFAGLLATRLGPEGALFFASDSGSLAAWSREILCGCGWAVETWEVPSDWPRTEFEMRFAAEGVRIHRFRATPP